MRMVLRNIVKQLKFILKRYIGALIIPQFVCAVRKVGSGEIFLVLNNIRYTVRTAFSEFVLFAWYVYI